jgi:hypothetical protein
MSARGSGEGVATAEQAPPNGASGEPADGVVQAPARAGGGGASDGRPAGNAPAAETWRSVLKGAWPVFLAGLPALVTLAALTFDLFPSLRPVVPPEVRRVEVTEAAVVERNRTLPDEEVTVVFFAVEAVGYDADAITVATLWMDAATLERVEADLVPHGVLTTNTRTDRVVGWLDVPYPYELPASSSGCLFLRVLLYPTSGEGEGRDATEPPDRAPFLLAYADTEPFDPYYADDRSCAAVVSPSPPAT